MRRITVEEAREHGIATAHEQMDNGEFRFRLVAEDGSAYVRTEAGERGAWQNSHSHERVVETHIVQTEWIGLAELVDGHDLSIRVLQRGDVFTTRPGTAHNIYLPRGAVVHTVKYGGPANDWHAAPTLDELTKSLNEEELKAMARFWG